jgi:hypothetical protein
MQFHFTNVSTLAEVSLQASHHSRRSASGHLIILDSHEISGQSILIKPPGNHAFSGQKLIKETNREKSLACLGIEGPALNVDA